MSYVTQKVTLMHDAITGTIACRSLCYLAPFPLEKTSVLSGI